MKRSDTWTTEIVQVSAAADGIVTNPRDVTIGAVEEACKAFMRSLQPSSKMTVRFIMKQLAEELGFPVCDRSGHPLKVEQLPWHMLTSDRVTTLTDAWAESGLTKNTTSLRLYVVKGISRACFMRHLIGAHQYMMLKEIKAPGGENLIGRGREVGNEWRDALLKHCLEDERIQGLRDAAMIALLFGSGIRRAEAASLKVETVNLQDAEFQIKAKGGHASLVPMSPLAVKHLTAWLEVRNKFLGPKGAVFCRILKNGRLLKTGIKPDTIYRLMMERSLNAGLPYLIRPHDARRTMATRIINDVGELAAQSALRHKNLSTTKIYDMRAREKVKQILKDFD